MISREVDIRSAKMMGGIGVILELVGGFIPYLRWVLPLAGLVLVLLALKRISDETGKPTIFKDFLISVIFMVIIPSILFSVMGRTTQLGSISKGFKTIHLGALFAFLLFWVVMLIGAYFLRMSYNTTAEATGVGTFETAASLIFYGAVLMIILIGGFVLLAGRIVEIVAFFSLPDILEVSTSH
jgi:uncharacterized membrane protein